MSHEQQDPKILEVDLRRPQLTRRQLLQLLGIGAATTALAACGSSGESATGGGTTPAAGASGTQAAGSGKRGGRFNGGVNLQLPPTGHYHWWVPNNIDLGLWGELEHSPPAFYRWNDDRYIPVLMEKASFVGGDTFELTLKKGLKWSNGQPLTSKDVVATWVLWRLNNNQVFRYVDRFEAKDEQTVSFHMNKPATVVERYILRGRVRPASIWGEWADKVAAQYAAGKTNSSDELKKLRGEFEQFRPQERLACGPYIMDLKSLTEASVELVRNPTGINADTARFDKVKLYVGETPVSTPLVLSKEMDFSTNGFAVATDKSMTAQGLRVLRTPAHSGPVVTINFANPKLKVFTDKRVRQAVAYAVNRKDNAEVSLGESAKPAQYMTGVPDDIIPKWMTEADLAKLNQYPYDQKKAADLLTAAGCKKGADGQWADPDGRPMVYEVMVPAEYQDHSASAQHLADELTKFGIRIVVRAVTFTQVPVERREGRFELAYDFWSTGHPHPHFSFVRTLLDKVQPLALGPYTAFELKQKTEVAGDVDFQELITNSAEGLDINAQKANVAKAALAFNELLPVIPLFSRYSNTLALEGVRVKGWPPDGDPIYENTLSGDNYVVIMISDGRLGPA